MQSVLKLVGAAVFAILVVLGVSVAWHGLYAYFPQSTQDSMRLIRVNRVTGSADVLSMSNGWRRIGSKMGNTFENSEPIPLPPGAVINNK